MSMHLLIFGGQIWVHKAKLEVVECINCVGARIARETVVTFPAIVYHLPLASSKLYCLVTEAHVCQQLAQGCYIKMEQPGVEPMTHSFAV